MSPPPLSCAASLQGIVHPMQNSQKQELRKAPHRAILHRKEFFVTGPEWLIVLRPRLLVPYAHSPNHPQSKVSELGSYFYFFPSPILTSISPPYHTASSISLKISCGCDLWSRYCNSFCTAFLDCTISLQYRSTLPLPHFELTAHIRVLHSSNSSHPHFPPFQNLEITPSLWRVSAKDR